MKPLDNLNCEGIHVILDKIAKKLYQFYIHYQIGTDYQHSKMTVSLSTEMIEFKKYCLALYNKSILEDYFWQFCPFDIYKSQFENRLQKYLLTYSPDCTAQDFIDDEISIIKSSEPKDGLDSGFTFFYPEDKEFKQNVEIVFYDFEDDIKLQNKIKYSQKRKLSFLESISGKFEFMLPKYPTGLFRDEWSFNLFMEMYNQYAKDKADNKARISYIYHVLDREEDCIYSNKTEFEKYVRDNLKLKFSRIQEVSQYKEFNEVVHVKKLKDIKSSFERKYPR